MEKEILQHKKWLPLALFLLILGFSIFAVVRYQKFLYQKMYEYKLVPIDETFTELYFEKPQSLPSSVTPRKQFSFAFTVHNLEGQDMRYPYSVYFTKDTGARIDVASGTLWVMKNTSLTTMVTTTFARAATGTMYVNLDSLDQSIDFLIGHN